MFVNCNSKKRLTEEKRERAVKFIVKTHHDETGAFGVFLLLCFFSAHGGHLFRKFRVFMYSNRCKPGEDKKRLFQKENISYIKNTLDRPQERGRGGGVVLF